MLFHKIVMNIFFKGEKKKSNKDEWVREWDGRVMEWVAPHLSNSYGIYKTKTKRKEQCVLCCSLSIALWFGWPSKICQIPPNPSIHPSSSTYKTSSELPTRLNHYPITCSLPPFLEYFRLFFIILIYHRYYYFSIF